jgi:hypothetical protein
MKQNYKTHVFALLIISVGIIAGSIGLMWHTNRNSSACDYVKDGTYYVDSGCRKVYESYQEKLAPFLISFLTLLPITLGLFFVRRETFIAWAIFASIGFPLMLGILLYTFNNKPAMGGWVGGPTDDQFASVLLPGLFVIISIVIIAMKSAKPAGN